jgi:hypothetical protein
MSNDFLPFAVGGSANVTPQATYAANTALTQGGFQSGIAKSPDMNKVCRQSSIMAAVVAQFIVNQTGANATDDGTTATLVSNLLAAVQASSRAVVGQARNVSAFLAAAGPSVTFTADEIVVQTALGGLSYLLPSFSKAVSLGTSGIGGVVGTTPAANGFAAVYAAFGVVAGTNIFVTDATAAKAPEVYGGTLPAGYTASALICIAPMGTTTANFAPFALTDRKVSWSGGNIITASTFVGGPTIRTSAALIPLNARSIGGFNQVGSSAATAISQVIAGTGINNMGGQFNTTNLAAGSSQAIPYEVDIVSPQSIFTQTSNSAGTPGFTVSTDWFRF